MRILFGMLTLALLAGGCTSSEPEAGPEISTPETTTTTHADATSTAPPTTAPTTTMSATPSTTSTTTTTTAHATTTTAGETATTATTVWVDPPPTTSTAVPAPADNEPPTVEITSPGNLSSHVAAYDPGLQAFRAVVSMSATVSDPNGDDVTIDWYSSVSGYLGTGEFITASLVTLYDSSQPFIMAKATDPYGAASEARIQIIVWVPSDT